MDLESMGASRTFSGPGAPSCNVPFFFLQPRDFISLKNLRRMDRLSAMVTASVRMALDDAGIKPSDVQYINAHGTSTDLNDLTETQAIKQVLGPRARGVPLFSTGHQGLAERRGLRLA